MSIQSWVTHNKKLTAIIIVMSLLILIIVRLFIFNETDTSGEPDYMLMLRLLLDALITTIIVTTSITFALRVLVPPKHDLNTEKFIDSYQIKDILSRAYLDSEKWQYFGQVGRYIRSNVLPKFVKHCYDNDKPGRIKILILNPENDRLCESYINLRKTSRNNNDGGNNWSLNRTKAELLTTILMLVYLDQKYGRVAIEAGFVDSLSIFRVDLSSNLVLVTQEDNQNPAILFDRNSIFYNSYLNEFVLVYGQSKKIAIQNAITPLNLTDSESIKKCMNEIDINPHGYDKEVFDSIIENFQKELL